MPYYRRRVVRFIWDFCKKPVLATKLPPTRVWFGFKEYYPEVGRVIVELIRNEGNIYLGFNWSKNVPGVSYGSIVELIHKAGMFPTNTDRGLFKGVMSSQRRYTGYNEIQVMIEPVNGEPFTLTAMKRCKTLFELLGMDVEKSDSPFPLVGNFTQESYSPTGDYMEFGTELYFEVFKNMPRHLSKLSQETVDKVT